MFTGIIQKTGNAALRGRRLEVRASAWRAKPGESIAVNGVCLTLTDSRQGRFYFDLLAETLKRTNLGDCRTVNLERSLRFGDPVDGHFVSGHVEGTGRVRSIQKKGADRIMEVACSPSLMRGIVGKGSIAVDGVSLTVVDVRRASFTVHLIPYTWENTAFSERKVGDHVNLETDMLGKYVSRKRPA